MTPAQSTLLPDALRDACRGRLERLRKRLAGEADALLVSAEKDIRYLSGFIGHDSLLLVFGDAAVIISDPRYDEHLEPWRRSGLADVVMGTRHRLEESVRSLCGERGAGRLAIQAEHVTLARHSRIGSTVTGWTITPTTGLVGGLRMRKDALEISRIEQALRWQQQALRTALDTLEPGMTERGLAARIEYEMKLCGAAGSGFAPIVGGGANSSVIHYETGDAPIQPGVLLIDWGATTPDGYNGDLTRTFAVGGPLPPRLREVYEIVREAQAAAIEAIAPGKICAEIDAVARGIIQRAGYGEHFGHGLGHGLGLDVHEAPFFNDLQTNVELAPGMVMTVEPGIYLPGIGGVRIEDDVLITDSGSRVLSDWPRDLDSASLDFAGAAQAIG